LLAERERRAGAQARYGVRLSTSSHATFGAS
jgi:hypothetical protein